MAHLDGVGLIGSVDWQQEVLRAGLVYLVAMMRTSSFRAVASTTSAGNIRPCVGAAFVKANDVLKLRRIRLVRTSQVSWCVDAAHVAPPCITLKDSRRIYRFT